MTQKWSDDDVTLQYARGTVALSALDELIVSANSWRERRRVIDAMAKGQHNDNDLSFASSVAQSLDRMAASLRDLESGNDDVDDGD